MAKLLPPAKTYAQIGSHGYRNIIMNKIIPEVRNRKHLEPAQTTQLGINTTYYHGNQLNNAEYISLYKSHSDYTKFATAIIAHQSSRQGITLGYREYTNLHTLHSVYYC